MTPEIQRLETEIATLTTAIATLARMPAAQAPLQVQLREKQAALAVLRGGAAASETSGGNTTTIHGDVQGSVLSGTFSGPVEIGGTTVNQGPVVSGPIHANQVHIAKEQTITNKGDTITVGDISNSSGIAIGAGAQSTVNTTTNNTTHAAGSVSITGGTVKGPVVGTNSGTISANYGTDKEEE